MSISNPRVLPRVFVFAKVTLSLMLACSLLVTAIQLVTDPITCDVKGVSGGIFNAFCWTHTTFTLPYSKPGDATAEF